jgi:uncharacterized membrane protein YqaE (UPF0057 family)
MKFIFIVAFLFIYIIAIILLKPARLHAKRIYSTAFLKYSYLIYLALFLLFTYLFLFYKEDLFFYFEDADDPRSTVHFIMLLLCFFIPNIGVLIRRKIKSRTIYNVILTVINFAFCGYIIFLIKMATDS